jgi:cyclophilin family peptidyl-prolyl cis-trans isomerase/HEAT repeat protein
MQRLGLVLKVTAALAGVCALAGAVPAPGSYTQILALESRRSLGDGELALFLASPDVRVAVRAALAIGRTKRAAGEPLLAARLNDPRVAVRAMSVYGLGLLATGARPRALVVALGDGSGAVRVAALDAIARYQSAGRYAPDVQNASQAAVEAALARDADAIVRGRAAIALVPFKDAPGAAEAADALATALRTDPSVDVRRNAMWAIYRAYARAVNRRLVESALRDPDEIVRIEAVRALGRYKDRSLVPFARPLLADPSWRVQEQAAETIRVLQGKPLSEHWTKIPPGVHVPPPAADPLASLPAMPRTPPGKLGAPAAGNAPPSLALEPVTAAQMTGPVHGAHPRVRIVTTKGAIYVALFPEWAPLTVANFLALANRGYYDHNRWFRIVPDFVVQTGDPNDNGEGDAGYSIGAEENPIAQDSYVISMGMNYDDKTNSPIRDSAGTQYYITLSPQLHLDWDFSVYGRVTSGFDVLGRLVESDRVVRVERIADENL